MTISEAAKYLRVTRKTLRAWSRRGSLTPLRIGKRGDRMYSVELINQYLGKWS